MHNEMPQLVRTGARIRTLFSFLKLSPCEYVVERWNAQHDEYVQSLLTNLPGGEVGALLVVMLVLFLLGFILDFIEITYVVIPIVGPILLAMGIDPIWLGIMDFPCFICAV